MQYSDAKAEAMEQALQVVQRVFDHLDIGVGVIVREQPNDDESFVMTYLNKAGRRAGGMPREDVVGRRMVDALPTIRERGFLQLYSQVLASGQPRDLGEVAYGDDQLEEAYYRSRLWPISDNALIVTFVNVTVQKRSQRLVERQREAILALSTPTIPLWRGILLLPLIGEIDAMRSQQLIEHMLRAIVDQQAQVAIFDITGVPVVDTAVAQSLLLAVRAAEMLGAHVLVTGITPELAMTLVKLNTGMGHVQTFRSLDRGIAAAFQYLQLDIVSAA